jgi:hypothetical protein
MLFPVSLSSEHKRIGKVLCHLREVGGLFPSVVEKEAQAEPGAQIKKPPIERGGPGRTQFRNVRGCGFADEGRFRICGGTKLHMTQACLRYLKAVLKSEFYLCSSK